MKLCSKCKKEYPRTLEYFSKDIRHKDNFCSQCRICQRELKKKSTRLWNKNNKEKKYQQTVDWRAKNKKKTCTYAKVYNKRVKQATPKDLKTIKQIMDIYYNCPEGLTVDHTIPIANKLVCGLNIPCNLTYMTLSANSSKKNHFIPYIENLQNKNIEYII